MSSSSLPSLSNHTQTSSSQRPIGSQGAGLHSTPERSAGLSGNRIQGVLSSSGNKNEGIVRRSLSNTQVQGDEKRREPVEDSNPVIQGDEKSKAIPEISSKINISERMRLGYVPNDSVGNQKRIEEQSRALRNAPTYTEFERKTVKFIPDGSDWILEDEGSKNFMFLSRDKQKSSRLSEDVEDEIRSFEDLGAAFDDEQPKTVNAPSKIVKRSLVTQAAKIEGLKQEFNGVQGSLKKVREELKNKQDELQENERPLEEIKMGIASISDKLKITIENKQKNEEILNGDASSLKIAKQKADHYINELREVSKLIKSAPQNFNGSENVLFVQKKLNVLSGEIDEFLASFVDAVNEQKILSKDTVYNQMRSGMESLKEELVSLSKLIGNEDCLKNDLKGLPEKFEELISSGCDELVRFLVVNIDFHYKSKRLDHELKEISDFIISSDFQKKRLQEKEGEIIFKSAEAKQEIMDLEEEERRLDKRKMALSEEIAKFPETDISKMSPNPTSANISDPILDDNLPASSSSSSSSSHVHSNQSSRMPEHEDLPPTTYSMEEIIRMMNAIQPED